MIFIDSNILLDIATSDPVWYGWSRDKLATAASGGEAYVNEVVYAELSVRFERAETLDLFLHRLGIAVVQTPKPALFLAGKAYGAYRAAGGTRTGVLPDFFIGAAALISGLGLLTRDPRRYRTYFPGLKLVTPL